MRSLSPAGQQTINAIAQRYGFSSDAVQTLLEAVSNGHGSMAQFNHPELGGSGQWMSGGMIMLGDMFNNYLKGRVDNLCYELANLLNNQPDLWQHDSTAANGVMDEWWGPTLRWPNSTGSQNGMRYAYFGQARRLAVEANGSVTIYDTLDHHIGGFSQQQGYGSSFSFSSQYGQFDISSLPVISVNGMAPVLTPHNTPAPAPVSVPTAAPTNNNSSNQADILATIERLGQLYNQGLLTNDEFNQKKAELLNRL